MGLSVIWTDPRGKEWNLTTGEQGVILDMGQAGLGWSPLDHVFTRGDTVHSSSRVKRGIHNLKVLVGWNVTEDDFYRLYSEWWTEANTPFALGELKVIRPDGTTRSRRLRLFDSPDTVFSFDPGLGIDPTPELWSVTGDSGWWMGTEQVAEYTQASLKGGNQTPFYGNSGRGWPLYISAAYSATGAVIDNLGQGPMWLTWTLVGPMANPRVGVAGNELVFQGTLLAGEVVTITTDPASRAVVDSGGNSRYGAVAGTWAPAPVGKRIPLTVGADSMGAGSRIYLSGRALYAQAF